MTDSIKEKVLEYCKFYFKDKNTCQCNDCKFWRSHWGTIADFTIKIIIGEIEERFGDFSGESPHLMEIYINEWEDFKESLKSNTIKTSVESKEAK